MTIRMDRLFTTCCIRSRSVYTLACALQDCLLCPPSSVFILSFHRCIDPTVGPLSRSGFEFPVSSREGDAGVGSSIYSTSTVSHWYILDWLSMRTRDGTEIANVRSASWSASWQEAEAQDLETQYASVLFNAKSATTTCG